MELFGWFID